MTTTPSQRTRRDHAATLEMADDLLDELNAEYARSGREASWADRSQVPSPTQYRPPAPELLMTEVFAERSATTRVTAGRLCFQDHNSGSENSDLESKFIQITSKTTERELWPEMTKSIWELPDPSLLISVIGGAIKTRSGLPTHLESLLKDDLLQTAVKTKAWLITGGSALGVDAMIGEAFYEHHILSPNMNDLILLGIAPECPGKHCTRTVQNGSGSTASAIEVYDVIEDSRLDGNHPYFLLGSDAEDSFRSRFENYVTNDLKKPLVTIVAGGDPSGTTVQAVKASLESQRPVVVLGGSGGAADLIAEAYRQFNGQESKMTTAQKDKASVKVKDIVDQLKPWLREQSQDDEVSQSKTVTLQLAIFDLENTNTETTLEKVIQSAALDCAQKGLPERLDLTMTWNECDRARQLLAVALPDGRLLSARSGRGLPSRPASSFPGPSRLVPGLAQPTRQASAVSGYHPRSTEKDPPLESTLTEKMKRALKEDRADFVQLFIEAGLTLPKFLSKHRLRQLYQKSDLPSIDKERKGNDFSDLPSMDKERKENDFTGINKIFTKMLKDPNFAFYSDDNNLRHERDLFLWSLVNNRPKLSLFFWRIGRDHMGGALIASALLARLSQKAEAKERTELSVDFKAQAVNWEKRAASVLSECYFADPFRTHRLLVRVLPHWGPQDTDHGNKKADHSKAAASQGNKVANHSSGPATGDQQTKKETDQREKQSSRAAKERYKRPTLLSLAESYGMMEFASQTACQTKLTSVWKGRLALSVSGWKILLVIFCPLLILSTRMIKMRTPVRELTTNENSIKTTLGYKRPTSVSPYPKRVPHVTQPVQRYNNVPVSLWFWKKDTVNIFLAVYYFYTAPQSKFFTTIISFMVYLSFLSYFAVVELSEGKEPTPSEIITWVWCGTLLVDEIRQMYFRDELTFRHKLKNWIWDVWNFIDLLMYLSFGLSVGVRFVQQEWGFNFRWVRAFYSVNLIFSFLRFMQNYFAVESLGPKVIMILKMIKDVLLFLSIFLVFMFGFGMAYIANIFPESSLDASILVNVLYYPYFQIYGEFFLDYMLGRNVDNCERNETIWRQDSYTATSRCPERSPVIMIILLAVYMILTNIVLVNLLIAIFTSTFQAVQDNAKKVWRFNRLSLIREYVDRPTFIPPFIVLNHLFRVLYTCFGQRYYHASPLRKVLTENEDKDLTLFERSAVTRYFKSSKENTVEQADVLELDLQKLKLKMKQVKNAISAVNAFSKPTSNAQS